MVVLAMLLELSCNQLEARKLPIKVDEEGTAKMVKLLQETFAKLDPMKIQYYDSNRKAAIFKAKLDKATDINEKMKLKMQYAFELLGGGKNEQAIMEFEQLLQTATDAKADPQSLDQIKKLLALCYVRIGETSNCIERFNEASCILPIQGKGVYNDQIGSRMAIRLYEDMLVENPNDYEAIWMLNFAYMTVGEYPQKVPKQFLVPPSFFESDYDLPAFKNIAQEIGVGTVALSGGTCVEDFNNDGLLDIMASSWGMNDQLRYFENDGNGHFTEKTDVAKLTGLTSGLNLQHADYDNDGFMDLLVLRGAWWQTQGNIPNSLIKNNGDGTFTDVTIQAGLLSFAPTQTAAWADFNNDGWLDLFIGNESAMEFKNPCEFYLNNQDGTFTDITKQVGLGTYQAYVKGVTAGDVNNDGWQDLYISTLTSNNMLLLNQTAQPGAMPVFMDVTDRAEVKQPFGGFATWMFDFNNDGWLDIFAGSYGSSTGVLAAEAATLNSQGKHIGGNPHLYINDGKTGKDAPHFTNITKQVGLNDALFVMGSNFGDLDNDGWLDFYLGTGAPSLSAVVPNKMYRNNEGKALQDVTTAGGFGILQKGHAVGFGDFDNDGDQDIFSVIGGALDGDVFTNAFHLNPIGNQQNWVTLKLIGTTSNRSAIGARVKITAIGKDGKERQVHGLISTGSSFGGNSLQLETGLGGATSIKQVEVKWPNAKGSVSVYKNIQINKYVELKEGNTEPVYLEKKRIQFPG